METFRSEHFCMRVRIFGNDRRNDYAFTFCDEIIYRKKAQVIFFSGAFLPCGRPGYSHFAVFAAHSFTSFRNCFNAATPIPAIRSLHLLRSCIRKTQPHIFNFFIISEISTFIRNVRILCNEKHGFYLCFSSRNRHPLISTMKPPLPQSALSCIPFRRARPRHAA